MAVPSKMDRVKIFHPMTCANWRDLGPSCSELGAITCEKCNLVMYCGKPCQAAHADIHKPDCEDEVARADWKPAWVRENRMPEFLAEGMKASPVTRRFPRFRFSFGNSPAMDLLNLENNEGSEGLDKPVEILSVGGDIRHGIQTVAGLPETYTGTLKFSFGEANMDIVARTIVTILISLVMEDRAAACDLMIHVWYSAHLRPGHVRIITELIRPLIAKANDSAIESSRGNPEVLWHGLNLVEHGRGMFIKLKIEEWRELLEYFTFHPDNDMDHPPTIVSRDEVVSGDYVRDERDLVLLRHPPHRRVAIEKFWRDGVVQPFGQQGRDFTVPNPFLFRGQNWSIEELADPLDGWNFDRVLNGPIGMPCSDLYGRLYVHLQATFNAFLTRFHSHNVVFEVLCVGPELLHQHMKKDSLARIDITAVMEDAPVEPEFLFKNYGPLLQRPEQNPSATMIGLYVTSLEEEAVKHEDLYPSRSQRNAVAELFGYDVRDTDVYSPDMVQLRDALPLIVDYEEAFRRFVHRSNLKRKLHNHRMKLKPHNGIVKEWPTRLEYFSGNPLLWRARQIYEQFLSSPHGGNERLVEFSRASRAPEKVGKIRY